MKNNQLLLSSAPSVQITPMSQYIEISIDRDITDPEDFRDEISAIRSAKEGDVIHITLNSGGGCLDTTLSIVSAMNQSSAHIICEAVGTVASAGTLIFLNGHEFRVNDGVSYMCHNSSVGYASKTNNMAEYILHQQKSIRALVEKSYKHFLTDDEIEKLLSGTDYWMDSEEVCTRLEARSAALKESDDLLELTREVANTWSKERLVAFICDDEYDDVAWELQESPVDSSAAHIDYETTSDINELKQVADDLSIKYPHNIKLETLRSKILKFIED